VKPDRNGRIWGVRETDPEGTGPPSQNGRMPLGSGVNAERRKAARRQKEKGRESGSESAVTEGGAGKTKDPPDKLGENVERIICPIG